MVELLAALEIIVFTGANSLLLVVDSPGAICTWATFTFCTPNLLQLLSALLAAGLLTCLFLAHIVIELPSFV